MTGVQTCALPISASSLTLTGLTKATTYTFTILATNSNGDGKTAASNEITTFNVPAASELTLSNGGANAIKADWTKPAENGTAITGYKLYVSTDANCNGNYVTGYAPKSISSADTLTETIQNLTDKTTYYIKAVSYTHLDVYKRQD